MNLMPQFASLPFGVIEIVGYWGKSTLGVAAATAGLTDKKLPPVAGDIDRFTVRPDDVVTLAAGRFYICHKLSFRILYNLRELSSTDGHR
jgi:hypothetical protein